ncbi:hypothetical protein TRFO_31455 [Tritrichomonas foetus]|uniref:Uncharacterized protein n=1 Tax=Tritrichomonas foetus TaxID=1144522 RepID=A0A1J4JWK3_9EUKA|nr:hypothetical protein TRFO_31455 [Tritrichomonas foetus]|eukprot:OHT01669.1 hypothetical protein TRFO_31455 [Tritrichomonas foetus]
MSAKDQKTKMATINKTIEKSLEKRLSTNGTAWMFIDKSPVKFTPAQKSQNARLLRNSTLITRNEKNERTEKVEKTENNGVFERNDKADKGQKGENKEKNEKNHPQNLSSLNLINKSEIDLIEHSLAQLQNGANNYDNYSRLERAKILNQSKISPSKKEASPVKHSTFDAIDFEIDENFDEGLYDDHKGLNFHEDNEINDGDDFSSDCFSNSPDAGLGDNNHFSVVGNIKDAKISNHVLKNMIRDEILNNGLNSSTNLTQNNHSTNNNSNVYNNNNLNNSNGNKVKKFNFADESHSKGRRHLLNVLELMGGNDIMLEEKHMKLPHEKTEIENQIGHTKIAKRMHEYLEEQGIEPPNFLTPPKSRPPSRQARKSLYD